MIPTSNYDDDDNYNINISSYTTPENFYNYLNYRVEKTPNEQQFLYTSQIKKNNGINQFTLTYNSQTNKFDFNGINCSLDVLMIPSVFVFMDNNNNITNSNNDINFKIDETLGSDALLFDTLIFQNGISDNSTLNIYNRFINLETIILGDNYFYNITISHLPSLKHISTIKGRTILLSHLLNLESVNVGECHDITIEDCDSLKNIDINKAAVVNLNGISHLKRCVGKCVDKLQLCNIMNQDDDDEKVDLFDFRNTEQVVFLNEANSHIRIRYCYLNNLVPSKSIGCTNPIVNFEVLYTPSIFYYDTVNNIYKPLFAKSVTRTHIEVLIFTGGDMYYNDDLHTYAEGYNPSCVSTIHFTNFYGNINVFYDIGVIYSKLFHGTQNREVFIGAPKYYAPHTFDSVNV